MSKMLPQITFFFFIYQPYSEVAESARSAATSWFAAFDSFYVPFALQSLQQQHSAACEPIQYEL